MEAGFSLGRSREAPMVASSPPETMKRVSPKPTMLTVSEQRVSGSRGHCDSVG